MNKKGQSLITFVLFLPIIVFFIALFIDSLLMYSERTRVKGITYDNLKIALKNDLKEEDKIKNIILTNEKDLDVLVNINEDDIKIKVKDEKKSIFGHLLKLDFYKIEFNYCANYLDKKIKEC